MKEIWINLELYIKSYKFSIFRDFFRTFLNLFQFLNDKNELNKGQKAGFFPRGATWMRRGTLGHEAALRGPTQRLRGKVTCANIYTYILYSL